MSEKFKADIEAIRRLTRSLKTLDLNLANVVTDKEYAMGGNMFYVIHSSDAASYINVRFNDVSSPQMRLVKMLGLRVPHERVFITTPSGQSGTMTILHGLIDPDLFAVIDNRTAATSIFEGILGELQGDMIPESCIGMTVSAAPGATRVLAQSMTRKGGYLQALSTNTGSVFLGFTNSVTVGGTPGVWFAELQAGESFPVDNYRGDIWAIATATQVVGMGEW